MKNKVTFTKAKLKKILIESASNIKDDKEREVVISAIKSIFSKKKIILKDVCEACGQPTKNFEIHPHCQEWWV